MSVKSHLDSLAIQLTIAEQEKAIIDKSIEVLAARAKSYFGSNLKEKIQFGSSARKTMLPRKVDYKSDVDYMLVLDNESYHKPQTLLNRVKGFVDYHYSKSEIYQSSLTVVLELNHIKFDLVPAFRASISSLLQIPAPASHYEDWIVTLPFSLNSEMDKAHANSGYELKPALRLLKYWNAINGYIYDSFPLEKRMIDAGIGWNDTVKTCLYAMINNLYSYRYELIDSKRLKTERAKELIDKTQYYESESMPYSAESEITKLLPNL